MTSLASFKTFPSGKTQTQLHPKINWNKSRQPQLSEKLQLVSFLIDTPPTLNSQQPGFQNTLLKPSNHILALILFFKHTKPHSGLGSFLRIHQTTFWPWLFSLNTPMQSCSYLRVWHFIFSQPHSHLKYTTRLCTGMGVDFGTLNFKEFHPISMPCPSTSKTQTIVFQGQQKAEAQELEPPRELHPKDKVPSGCT